jgi:tetratricopeptide (TPR) repeat protein
VKNLYGIILILLSISCSLGNRLTDEQISEEVKNLEPSQALSKLVELDQEYTDNVSLKANIGALFIAGRDYQNANIFLDRAVELVEAKKRSSEMGRYLTYANSAVVKLYRQEFDLAEEYGAKALEANEKDPVGAGLTYAAALYENKKFQEAAERITPFWNERREIMNSRDLYNFTDLLIRGADFQNALQVFDYLELKTGYRSGYGIRQSIILENLGLYAESIMAAFKDLDIERYNGRVQGDFIQNNMRQVLANLERANLDQSELDELNQMVSGLEAYVNEDYAQAVVLLDGIQVDDPYFTFVYLGSKMMSQPELEDMARFVEFEKIFENHPGLYYLLWNGMKIGPGDYSFAGARSVIEKVISLSPRSLYGVESRNELARFFGVEDVDLLLIGTEMDEIFKNVVITNNPEIMADLIFMLSLPDNPYTDMADLLISRMVLNPAVSEFLNESLESWPDKIRIRLTEILKK